MSTEAAAATRRPAYTSTFIFEIGDLDDDFHRLNDEIAERARAIDGFLGEEAWHNEETGLHAEVYYWADREALNQLVGMDTHRIAKVRNEEWLGAYRVVISEVRSVYGDPTLGLEHRPVDG
ncbi:hypothetical protein P5G50_12775 [Leifsonia sp. F6_8S_P_1B]|uniref:Antibiotic biosynthesis monooxygenase n=1 Tax=Leifsonia williamsii TaxID=3035919 RepID=A0ABT8KCZ5_9MICO|nr:hypothetical protein [Leifsonia williamsii]MDN4615321.1 hypothetical protein [Leifsonia williamsii]